MCVEGAFFLVLVDVFYCVNYNPSQSGIGSRDANCVHKISDVTDV